MHLRGLPLGIFHKIQHFPTLRSAWLEGARGIACGCWDAADCLAPNQHWHVDTVASVVHIKMYQVTVLWWQVEKSNMMLPKFRVKLHIHSTAMFCQCEAHGVKCAWFFAHLARCADPAFQVIHGTFSSFLDCTKKPLSGCPWTLHRTHRCDCIWLYVSTSCKILHSGYIVVASASICKLNYKIFITWTCCC